MKWIITVGGGYGSFEFEGTKQEAETMRKNKARSEGAPATMRRLTKRAADASPESPLKNKRQVAKRR